MSIEMSLVHVFHDTFKLPVRLDPTIPSKDEITLRIKLLREEVDELEQALLKGDLVNTLQELTDIRYVLNGTFLTCGLQRLEEQAFDLVHDANMNKLWLDGNPHYNEHGKVIKPPGYKPVDLSVLFKSN